MAVLTVKDMNGKEFNVNTDTITSISGDIVEDKKNGNFVSDSYEQNRVQQVRDIAFVDVKGNPVDNISSLKKMMMIKLILLKFIKKNLKWINKY